jgi:hypothetical protein
LIHQVFSNLSMTCVMMVTKKCTFGYLQKRDIQAKVYLTNLTRKVTSNCLYKTIKPGDRSVVHRGVRNDLSICKELKRQNALHFDYTCEVADEPIGCVGKFYDERKKPIVFSESLEKPSERALILIITSSIMVPSVDRFFLGNSS